MFLVIFGCSTLLNTIIECVMKHPNDALRIAIGIGGMRIVDKELDMMDGYEFMKVINGCSTDNDKISKV